MIKIYVVDDEPMAIQYFECLLRDSGSDCEICGSSTNSIRALDEIQKKKPDVVFTDIRMPIMDGLELAHQVIENTGAIVYLLTSYEDFDYAKKGVKIGVEDYILKNELSENLLRGILDRAKEKVAQRREERHVILERNLQAFLEDDSGTGNFEGVYAHSLQRYAIACFFFSFFIYMQPGEDQDRRWHYDCRKLQNLNFPKGVTCKGVVKSKRNEYSAVFFLSPDANDGRRLLYKASDVILQELSKDNNGWKCISCDPQLHFMDIQQAYRQAEKYSYYLYARLEKKIFHPEDFEGLETGASLNESMLEQIRLFMGKEEHEKSVQAIRAFFDWSREHLGLPEYTEAMRSLLRVIRGSTAQKHLNSDNYLISSVYSDSVDLERALLNCVEMYFDELADNKNVAYSEHILKAMDFVRKHYMEDISVSVMAAVTGISEGHLRRLFKQELKTNVIDYITDFRVEKARQLLEDESMEFSDIWKQTGFSSAQYFNVVFKKKMGMLPREYMRRKRGIR